MGEQNTSHISRRSFIATAATLAAAPKPSRMNVVFILTDDQGYGDLACHGNPVIQTPHLDRLHAESTRFTNFYSSPLCSPTRSSLMTGRYNYRTGIVDTWVGLAQMRSSEITLAEMFRGAGYRTALFGKWHLGDNYPMRPMDQGFNESLTFTDGAIGSLGDPSPNTYFDPVFFRNGVPEKTRGYCTDIFFNETMRFLERKSDRPALVYLPVNVPHGPLQVAESYADPYRKAGMDDTTSRVYGMIANLDENIGRLLEFLKTSGLEKDTLVIFMSDNGPWGTPRYNAGLRDVKGTVYEGGIKVPFFMRAPGRLRSGADIDRIAAHIDVLPTLLELCGVKAPGSVRMDGRSLVPLLQGQATNWQPRTLFFQQTRPDPNGIDEPRLFTHAAARSQRFKIVMSAPRPAEIYTKAISEAETQLYDLEKDPGEKNNVASAHPQVVSAMRQDYERWFRDVTAGLDSPVRIHLGAKAANPVLLTPQDLHGPRAFLSPWNYDRAKAYWKAEPDGHGYWEVEVVRSGRYEFVTRLGTAELPQPLKAGLASFAAGSLKEAQPIAGGSTAVTFKVRLKAGPARLEIGYSGQRKDGQVITPYFVDIKYLGN
jgi:arylsulfatase A-like enzyme